MANVCTNTVTFAGSSEALAAIGAEFDELQTASPGRRTVAYPLVL